MPSALQHFTTFFVLPIIFRTFLISSSITLKREAASGSSFFTSSEWMKSDSRYAHVPWISDINWLTSATFISFLFHPSIRSAKVSL